MIVSLIPILFWGAALACAGIDVWQGPRPILPAVVIDRLLRYLLLFPIGLQGLWAAFFHIVFPSVAADAIGWAPSPFQYEVGVANLGIGLAGIYAAFKGFEARLAVAIASGCFLIGAGIGHIKNVIEAGNFAPGNAGPIMVTDFLTPIAILALLLFSSEMWRPKSTVTLALEEELKAARDAMRVYRKALDDLGKN